MNAGYIGFLGEDDLFEGKLICAKVQQKKNDKRKDNLQVHLVTEDMLNGIETDYSQIKVKMHKSIDTVIKQVYF